VHTNPGFHHVPDPSVLYLSPNWKTPPFDDARVRQAFSLALDRKALVANAYQGAAQPTIHMIPEGTPEYNAELRDAAGRSGDAAVTADTAKAVELWNAYLNEKCPQRAAAGGNIYFMPASYSSYVQKAIAAAITMWNDTLPGVKVEAYTVSGVKQVHFQNRMPLSNFSWYADYPDPQQLIDPLIRPSDRDGSTEVTLPAADTLLESAGFNLNPAGRLAQYQQAEQIAISQTAFIPISQKLHSWIAPPALVGGWAYTSAGSVPLSAWQSAYRVKYAKIAPQPRSLIRQCAMRLRWGMQVLVAQGLAGGKQRRHALLCLLELAQLDERLALQIEDVLLAEHV
jgi:ABC-type oligopeptide transport system substrate-binding subunit